VEFPLAGYILVVDDEPDVRELFKITLSMAGYRTAVASNGLQALDEIAKESPALIVLDLMMPHLDGFGVLDKLREEKKNGPLKVLVATAKTLDDGDKEQLDSWPVVGVLNKGELDLPKMVRHVQSLVPGAG
jgi:CheY-like chemotaxis protein